MSHRFLAVPARSTLPVTLFAIQRASTREELQGLLDTIIARLMNMLTRQGYLVEEQGVRYLADVDADGPLEPLAAACTYRIAFGPRAGQTLSQRTVPSRYEKTTPGGLCANAHGFSLHAAVRCGAHQRKELDHPPRDRQRTAQAQ